MSSSNTWQCDAANSDNVETLRITQKFLGRLRISKILDDSTKEFSSTSRISKKILDGHQKRRVSEASKTKGFLSFIIVGNIMNMENKRLNSKRLLIKYGRKKRGKRSSGYNYTFTE